MDSTHIRGTGDVGSRKRFRRVRNEEFVCQHCGTRVRPLSNGSCRNHCPQCLWSKHVDLIPGDRAAGCGGLMPCVAVRRDARRGWLLVHRCLECGQESKNRAARGSLQSDCVEVMARVAREASARLIKRRRRRGRSRAV
ncbi:RNHCP domain-containing protein [Planctomycetota bacterium]